MANVSTSIKSLTINFLPQTTEVYVYQESPEPDNLYWGDGCKHKTFTASQSLENILSEIADYLHWESVCPTCRGSKTPEPGAKFCGDMYHVDSGSNLLGIFDEAVITPV